MTSSIFALEGGGVKGGGVFFRKLARRASRGDLAVEYQGETEWMETNKEVTACNGFNNG